MKAILFDLDSVIYQGDQAFAGAADTVAWVRSQGILHRFLTNTTSRPGSDIAEKVRLMGILVDPDSVLTPPVAVRRWLFERGVRVEAARSEGSMYHIAHDGQCETSGLCVTLGLPNGS